MVVLPRPDNPAVSCGLRHELFGLYEVAVSKAFAVNPNILGLGCNIPCTDIQTLLKMTSPLPILKSNPDFRSVIVLSNLQWLVLSDNLSTSPPWSGTYRKTSPRSRFPLISNRYSKPPQSLKQSDQRAIVWLRSIESYISAHC
jgi:hypothetical protein